MRIEAPTRLDRVVLAFVSGPVGHLLGTVLELLSIAADSARRRLRARLSRRR